MSAAITESQSYALGRDLTLDEALMLARRATFDPGAFTTRVPYGELEQETLERWQARALLVALAADRSDDRWATVNKQGPHVTEHERAELRRVLEGRP